MADVSQPRSIPSKSGQYIRHRGTGSTEKARVVLRNTGEDSYFSTGGFDICHAILAALYRVKLTYLVSGPSRRHTESDPVLLRQSCDTRHMHSHMGVHVIPYLRAGRTEA